MNFIRALLIFFFGHRKPADFPGAAIPFPLNPDPPPKIRLPGDFLSKNFKRSELTNSDTAVRMGIPNLPTTEEHWVNIETILAPALQAIRDHLGRPLEVNSGYRTQALNNVLPGSAVRSYHMLGLAADLDAAGMTNEKLGREVVTALTAAKIDFDQVLIESNSMGHQWVHLGLPKKGENGRKQVMNLFVNV